jgi:hypothetical protein
MSFHFPLEGPLLFSFRIFIIRKFTMKKRYVLHWIILLYHNMLGNMIIPPYLGNFEED